MSEIIVLEFASMQDGKIKAVACTGFVVSRTNNDARQNEHKVILWVDGSRKPDWFCGYELQCV